LREYGTIPITIIERQGMFSSIHRKWVLLRKRMEKDNANMDIMSYKTDYRNFSSTLSSRYNDWYLLPEIPDLHINQPDIFSGKPIIQ
jgi:hypothetical protein